MTGLLARIFAPAALGLSVLLAAPSPDAPSREYAPIPDLPSLTDEQIVEKAWYQATMLAWDCADYKSGMIADRIPANLSPDHCDGNINVVTGATGFSIMALIAGVEKGWLTRNQVFGRVRTIVDFLKTAETWYGMFPHMMSASTGKIVGFDGKHDMGGDTVETAILMMGLLTARQFFSGEDIGESTLRKDINKLWEGVDWTWYVKEQYGQKHLFWILGPETFRKLQEHPLEMQPHARAGEGLLAVIMGSISPTYPIPPEIYRKSVETAEQYRNGQTLFGIKLPLGPEGGGNLFTTAYNFAAIDPRGLTNNGVDFEEQFRSHPLIDYAYSQSKGGNPIGWTLSATDDAPSGQYRGHFIGNDTGTYTPPMAGAFMAVMKEKSIAALHYLYQNRGKGWWGTFGTPSAINPEVNWVGPDILVMDKMMEVIGFANNEDILWSITRKIPEFQKLADLRFESPYIVGKESLIANIAPN